MALDPHWTFETLRETLAELGHTAATVAEVYTADGLVDAIFAAESTHV